MSGHDWPGARAVPDDVQGGYGACPGCVIEATTWVCSNTEDDTAPTA